MSELTIPGTKIRGIAACVPESLEGVDGLSQRLGRENAEKLIASTGVRFRRFVKPGQTTSDLCEKAAKALLQEMNWAPESIDVLVFISQTPDYILPPTACVLHERLGLAKTAACFDVNLGCSGWVYGLWMASSFLRAGLKRALILTGDTIATVSPYDNTAVLGSDAGSATVLEADEQGLHHFSFGSDGSGHQALWIPAGGFRKRVGPDTKEFTKGEDGILRTPEHTHMSGADVFSFTIREVPPMIDRTLKLAGWAKTDVDAFVLHQANKMLLDYLGKKMGLPPEKRPVSLHDFGNTSGASVPLTMVHCLADQLRGDPRKYICAGFGVGLSWACLGVVLGGLVIPPMQYLE